MRNDLTLDDPETLHLGSESIVNSEPRTPGRAGLFVAVGMLIAFAGMGAFTFITNDQFKKADQQRLQAESVRTDLQLTTTQLETTKQALAGVKTELSESQALLETTRQTLAGVKTELSESQARLETTKQTLALSGSGTAPGRFLSMDAMVDDYLRGVDVLTDPTYRPVVESCRADREACRTRLKALIPQLDLALVAEHVVKKAATKQITASTAAVVGYKAFRLNNTTKKNDVLEFLKKYLVSGDVTPKATDQIAKLMNKPGFNWGAIIAMADGAVWFVRGNIDRQSGAVSGLTDRKTTAVSVLIENLAGAEVTENGELLRGRDGAQPAVISRPVRGTPVEDHCRPRQC